MDELLGLQPKLAELQEQGVDLYVFVNGSRADNLQFFQRNPLQAVILADQEIEVARRFGVTALPQSFFVDRQGRLAAGIIGWGKNSYQDSVLPLLEALLDEE